MWDYTLRRLSLFHRYRSFISRQHQHRCRRVQVGTYLLFVGEVYAWFVVGEIVGRGFTLVDYDI